MKFSDVTFDMAVAINKNVDPVRVTVALVGCDVPDEVVAAALVAGNSPRVAAQSRLRRDGIPVGKRLEMPWSDWIGRPARVSAPMTAEQAFQLVMNDPTQVARMKEQIRQMEMIANRQPDAPAADDTNDE